MRRSAGVAALLWLAGCAHGPVEHEARTPKEEAQALLKAEQLERAQSLLLQLQARDPSDLDVARWLVEASLKLGTQAKLLASVEGPGPLREDVRHYVRGLLFFGRSGAEAKAAVRELEQAATLRPEIAEFHYRIGLIHLESEAYELAVGELQRARALAPTLRAALLPLAKALAKTGQRDEAMQVLRSLIAAKPTAAEVKVARTLDAEIGDAFAAIPSSARSKVEEGIKLLDQYDSPQRAIVEFEDVLSQFPDLAAVHGLLGLSYQRLDDAGRAIESLKKAIELEPGIGRHYLYLGEIYRTHQRPEKAEEEYKKALAHDPLLDAAYLHLGDVALDRRQLDDAVSAFGALSAINPDASVPRSKLAAALQLQGNFTSADRELRTALQSEPQNLELQLQLGLLHTERSLAAKGEDRRTAAQEASMWLKKVLQAQPENAAASRALERLSTKE